jgi:hypothetical protein
MKEKQHVAGHQAAKQQPKPMSKSEAERLARRLRNCGVRRLKNWK